MLDAMRLASVAAKTVGIIKGDKPDTVFGTAEALWLATRGGAELLHMHDKIGELKAGMQFDALVVHVPTA